MVQTMAARTCSGKPGPRGAEGVWVLNGFYSPRGGALILIKYGFERLLFF